MRTLSIFLQQISSILPARIPDSVQFEQDFVYSLLKADLDDAGDACDKLTTGLQHDFGPFTRARLFSLTKLNMQKFASGFTERTF